MKKTKHIAQFESFSEGSAFRESFNDYMNGVICIADYGGGGLAVGTLNSRSDASYIQELEQFVPKDRTYGKDYSSQIGIDVFGSSGEPGSFVSFSDGQFTLHESGETYKASDDSYVFTIPNGMFLVLTDGYGSYDLLTAKEVRDYFGR